MESKEYKNEINNLLKIEEIVCKNGEKINLNKDDVVIFVGANNVGKSTILKEMEKVIQNKKDNNKIVEDLKFYENNNVNYNIVNQYLDSNFKDKYGNYETIDNNGNSFNFSRQEKYSQYEIKELKNFFYTFLNTESRLTFINLDNSYNSQLTKKKNNYYLKIKNNKENLNNINQRMFKAFKYGILTNEEESMSDGYFVGKYKYSSETEIRNILDDKYGNLIGKKEKLENLTEQGDGVKSYVSILIQLMVGDPPIFFIDEPETFLHQPQVHQIGYDIMELSQGKQCFITTHNIELIKGMIEANSNRIKIIKVERNNNNNNFLQLKNEDINMVSMDPVLKYTNILDGIFYKRVFLTENDADSLFYSTIMENVNREYYNDTLFCGVNGKENFKKFTNILNKFKIKYEIIADFDFIFRRQTVESTVILNDDIKGNINTFYNFFEKYKEDIIGEKLTKENIITKVNKIIDGRGEIIDDETIKDLRKYINSMYNKLNRLKKNGLIEINENQKTYFNDFIQVLKEHNINIVPYGELESAIDVEKIKSNNEHIPHGINWVFYVMNKIPNLEDKAYSRATDFIKSIINSKEKIWKFCF